MWEPKRDTGGGQEIRYWPYQNAATGTVLIKVS